MNLLVPVDGCPNCIDALAHPYRVTGDGTADGIVAYYRCPACLYSWWTSWHSSALSLRCPGCPACVREAGAA